MVVQQPAPPSVVVAAPPPAVVVAPRPTVVVAPPAPGWGGRYWIFPKLTTDDVDAADVAALAIERVMAGERLLTTEPLYLRRPDAVPAAAAPNARVLGK